MLEVAAEGAAGLLVVSGEGPQEFLGVCDAPRVQWAVSRDQVSSRPLTAGRRAEIEGETVVTGAVVSDVGVPQHATRGAGRGQGLGPGQAQRVGLGVTVAGGVVGGVVGATGEDADDFCAVGEGDP